MKNCRHNRTNNPRRFAFFIISIFICISTGLAQSPPTRFPARPKPVASELPQYPPIARAACVQGTAAVLVEIDSTGMVITTDVLYGHPLLWRAAETAVRRWKFDVIGKELGPRREAIRFDFKILPFEVSVTKLKPVWLTDTDVEIRAHPPEPICNDCTERRRLELRRGRGGCPG